MENFEAPEVSSFTQNQDTFQYQSTQNQSDLLFAHPGWVNFRKLRDIAHSVQQLGRSKPKKRPELNLVHAFYLPQLPFSSFEVLKQELRDPTFGDQMLANGGLESMIRVIQALGQVRFTDQPDAGKASACSAVRSALMDFDADREANEKVMNTYGGEWRQKTSETLKDHPALAEAIERERLKVEAVERAKEERERAQEQARLDQERKEAELRKSLERNLTKQTERLSVDLAALDLPGYKSLREDEGFLKAFEAVYDKKFSLTALHAFHPIEKQLYKALVALEVDIRAAEAAKVQAQLDWENSLLTADELSARLGLLKSEVDSWRDLGRIPVAKSKSNSRFKTAVRLYDPEAVSQVCTPGALKAWRAEDEESLNSRQRAERKQAIADAQAKVFAEQSIATISKTLGAQVAQRSPEGIVWSKIVTLELKVDLGAGKPRTWSCEVGIRRKSVTPTDKDQLKKVMADLKLVWTSAAIKKLQRTVSDSMSDVVEVYRSEISPAQVEALVNGFVSATTKGFHINSETQILRAQDWLPRSELGVLDEVDAMRAGNLLRLHDYPYTFPLARQMGRRIHGKFGPTNSGKTHSAMQAMAEAQSGIYLAPLRLLAMEIRDRLMASGVPCNLLTGEEHVMVEGAKHTACTIEMMNAQEPVDVAVIDEIQMISDADRGWAWTAALVGAPARDVFVCGAVAAKKVCEEVAASLGEEMTIEMLTRKNELQAVQMKKEATSSSKGKSTGRDFKIERGDALIAFSRKDVLTLSARYRNKGFKVSTIYGALAPEVRRAEAQRFADGESDLVVATDAVGMGLNLPVKRIVFSTVHKFDGEQVRMLNAPELQQIAGRAGRFGMHEKGIVTAMDQEDFAVVQMRLGEQVPALALPLGIAPNLEHINALAQLLKTQKIGAILAFFANKISLDSKTYKTSKMETSVALGHRVDSLLKTNQQDLGLREKFIFACAPVSSSNMDEQYYFDECLIDHAMGRESSLPEIPEWVHSNDYRYLDAAEDLNKRYTLYAWLSFKFPETFVEFEQVHPLRSEINAYIEKALVRQGGFGVTSKEAFKQRNRDH